MAQNGAEWARNFLSGVWSNQNINVKRTLYRDNTSWLNYAGSFGSDVIDRYRWEGGCIVEHVSLHPSRPRPRPRSPIHHLLPSPYLFLCLEIYS